MASKTRDSSRRRPGRWRMGVQGAMLLAWLGPFGLRMHTVCSPVFHCYSCPWASFACPIGVLANFSAIHTVPLLAVGTLLVVGSLFGSLICGWVCPFGFLQDLLGRIPTPKVAIPSWLGNCRYVVLAVLVLAAPYFFGENSPLFVCRLCPAGALEAALPSMARQAMAGQAIVWPSIVKLTVLLVFLGLALFTWRPWCTVLCPLGAIYGLCNRFSIFFVRFQPEACNDCDLCRKLCRVRGAEERRAGASRCIRCLDCTGCGAIGIGTAFGGHDRAAKTPAQT